MDEYRQLPLPDVVLSGSAQARGSPLLDIVELRASESHYYFVLVLPLVQPLPGGSHRLRLGVTSNGRVIIHGITPPGSILENPLPRVQKGKRVQLCPDEMWGLSFYLPGPVDKMTVQIRLRSETVIEVRVTKKEP